MKLEYNNFDRLTFNQWLIVFKDIDVTRNKHLDISIYKNEYKLYLQECKLKDGIDIEFI